MRFAAIVLLACALHAGDPRPPAKAPAARPADAHIEADIRARFAKSKINADHFTVRVQGGVATLEGKTDVVQHKGVATRLARSGGAINVNNKIQVSDAARKKAADNLEKGRRRLQIERGEPRSEPPSAATRPRR
jgi:hypothetical protein